MKKLVALILTLAMVLSVASFAAADEPIKVTFWHTRGSGANLECTQYAVSQFNETIGKEKNIVVEEVFIGNYVEILSKTQLAVQAGEQPQLVVSERASVPVLVDDGIVVDMLPYAQRDGLDLDNFYEVFVNTYGMIDGKLMSLPYIRSTPVFYYNKGMADAAGLAAPTTIEELEAFGKALTKVAANGETEVFGFEMLNDFGWFCQNMLYQLGSNMLSEDGLSSPALTDGTMEKILTAWRQWIDDGWCAPFVSTSAETAMKENFYQGRLASFFASCGGMKNIEKLSAENGIVLGVAPLPTWDKPAAPVGGGNICIVGGSNTQEQIDATWEFVKFLMSDEMVAYNAMNSGYLPTTKSAGESQAMKDFWAEHPLWKVAYDQLPYAQDMPYSIYRLDFTDACQTATSLMVQEQSITAAEALQQIQDEASAIFP